MFIILCRIMGVDGGSAFLISITCSGIVLRYNTLSNLGYVFLIGRGRGRSKETLDEEEGEKGESERQRE